MNDDVMGFALDEVPPGHQVVAWCVGVMCISPEARLVVIPRGDGSPEEVDTICDAIKGYAHGPKWRYGHEETT